MAKRTPEQLQVEQTKAEQAKAERLAAALRENLRRRKAQARGDGDAPDVNTKDEAG